VTERLVAAKRLMWGPVVAVGVGLSLVSAGVSAQESSQGGGADALEEVVVTGSRIRRDTPLGNIAITEIDAGQIELRGFVNPIESLEQLPFVEVGVNNRGTSTQFGDNNAYINLYGLGQQRTLTLIDGRRMVSSVQGTVFNTGNNTGSQVDVTIINPSVIKGTQVRTVGAGAVYGADAVAGVVNFILDREFKGFKATTQYGISDLSDGRSKRVSLAWGDEFFDGRANLVLAGEYFEQDPVYFGPNRPFALVGSGANPLSASLQTVCETRSSSSIRSRCRRRSGAAWTCVARTRAARCSCTSRRSAPPQPLRRAPVPTVVLLLATTSLRLAVPTLTLLAAPTRLSAA